MRRSRRNFEVTNVFEVNLLHPDVRKITNNSKDVTEAKVTGFKDIGGHAESNPTRVPGLGRSGRDPRIPSASSVTPQEETTLR